MKLKSLLLGSAAALALSTGAQAADPIANFVSLGVCDAYGISGLTIESDDTCLKISGNVKYKFEVREYDNVFSNNTAFETESKVEWRAIFEATTQTDGGPAIAHIRLREGPAVVTNNLTGVTNNQFARVDRAYVQFGDTTVLSAGRKGSIFSTALVDRNFGWLDFDELDNGDLRNGLLSGEAGTGGDVIQIESLIADGFTVLAALENLNKDGTFGLGVRYDNAGIAAEAGILYGGLFNTAPGNEILNFYANVEASFDAFVVRAGVIANDKDDWIASLGASATFDMFTLDVDAVFAEGDEFFIGAEGGFAATDTVDVYLGANYAENLMARGSVKGNYYGDLTGVETLFTVYGGVKVALTETISANAEVGYVEGTIAGATTDLVYGAAGVAYKPGGNFETSLDVYADTRDAYAVTFKASKSF